MLSSGCKIGSKLGHFSKNHDFKNPKLAWPGRGQKKYRLLSSKREVQIVPISFGLVKKRVAKWPIWVILLSCLYSIYIYIYSIYAPCAQVQYAVEILIISFKVFEILTIITLIGQLTN